MAKMRSLLLSSVNVAAAEANCGRVDRRAIPGVVSGRRTFWFAVAAPILMYG
jgi:hypothetical protein